jgi:hypothetical protein
LGIALSELQKLDEAAQEFREVLPPAGMALGL